MTPQAEKRTARWDALVREVDAAFGGNAIHVADREGDAFVHWAAWREDNIRFVVRAKADRHLEHARMSEVIAVAPVRLEREVALSSRKGSNRKSDVTKKNRAPRTGRMATLEVRATTMTISRPPLSQAPQHACTLNVVHVVEVGAAPDETPVEWTLLTSEAVTTPEEVARVVDLYRKRWVIEEFFKALKTGCAYEDRQLMSLRALLNGLVVAVPVAWRMLALRSLAHRTPEEPASSLFAEDELRLLRVVSKRVRLQEKPTVDEVLRAIAGLGGHLKRNGPPGWQTLGRGFDRFLDQYTGWVAAGRCDQS